MGNLLDNNNTVQGSAGRNEAALLSTNQVVQNKLEPISQNFGNNLIANITQRNWTKVRNFFKVIFLRNQSDKGFAQDLGIVEEEKN